MPAVTSNPTTHHLPTFYAWVSFIPKDIRRRKEDWREEGKGYMKKLRKKEGGPSPPCSPPPHLTCYSQTTASDQNGTTRKCFVHHVNRPGNEILNRCDGRIEPAGWEGGGGRRRGRHLWVLFQCCCFTFCLLVCSLLMVLLSPCVGRICRMNAEEGNPLFYPCLCSGSIKYVHQQCLVGLSEDPLTRSRC